MSTPSPPTMRRVLMFWLPLAATWLMMSMEGPMLAAFIARLPEAKLNLAAFGVAFSLALIVEAPIIMMLSASTALVQDRGSYLQLRRFSNLLNAAVTLAMGLVLLPPVFHLLATRLMDLPHEVVWRAHGATMLLLPWPGAIGIRRFYQGVLIRGGTPRRVATGTVLRITTVVIMATSLSLLTGLEGSWIAGLSLSVAVMIEAGASRMMAARTIREILGGEATFQADAGTEARAGSGAPPSLASIAAFYWPLALTSVLALGVQPMITFFLGHSRAALESLAVQPVIGSLVFIFRSMGLAFQEVAIALMGDQREGYPTLRRFATWLGIGVAVGLALIGWTPLSAIWFGRISGLTPDLVAFCEAPTRVLFIMPALTVLLSWQRALLVHVKHTAPVTWASALEILITLTVLVITIQGLDMVGALAAAISILIGRVVANTYLALPLRRLLATS